MWVRTLISRDSLRVVARIGPSSKWEEASMEQFTSGLYRLLFKFEILKDNEYAVQIFAVGCTLTRRCA
jgi:hypothetical protein